MGHQRPLVPNMSLSIVSDSTPYYLGTQEYSNLGIAIALKSKNMVCMTTQLDF